MMVSTRQQESIKRLAFAITDVMEQDINGAIATALQENGITDIRIFMSIRAEDLDDLSYTLEDGTQKVLDKAEQGLLRSFLSFICHHGANGNIFEDYWNLVNVENFDAYCTRNS